MDLAVQAYENSKFWEIIFDIKNVLGIEIQKKDFIYDIKNFYIDKNIDSYFLEIVKRKIPKETLLEYSGNSFYDIAK